MNEREQRLAEIREGEKAARLVPWRKEYVTGGAAAEHRCDIRFLLAEVDRLADENQGLRLDAIQDEGMWSSQDAGLRAEVERLTAERDALRELLGRLYRQANDTDWDYDLTVGRCDDLLNEVRSALTKEATDGK